MRMSWQSCPATTSAIVGNHDMLFSVALLSHDTLHESSLYVCIYNKLIRKFKIIHSRIHMATFVKIN